MTNRNRFPSREIVEQVRKLYPAGCRVQLIHLDDDPHSDLLPGDLGTVSIVDDTGTIFVNWDRGSTLGMVYGVDKVRKL